MDRSAPADGLPIPDLPPEDVARAVVAEIERDLGVLSGLLAVGEMAIGAFRERLGCGEEREPAKAFDRLSRAVRRTIAMRMRLRQERMAAMRGQFRPPAAAPAAAQAAKAAGGAAATEKRDGRGVNLLGDLRDRADDPEDGSENGNTPSVEVYRSVCADLGVQPDAAAFTRSAPAAAPAMAGGPGRARRAAPDAAGLAAVRDALAARFGTPTAERFRPPAGGPARDRGVRMGSGRDPPRSL